MRSGLTIKKDAAASFFIAESVYRLQLRQDVIGDNPAVLNVVRIIQAAIETVRGAHAIALPSIVVS